MKVVCLLFIVFLTIFSAMPVYSQTSSLMQGIIRANNPTTTPCPSGANRTFQFLGNNTDINGIASPNFSGATMSECYSDCCMYGTGFKIRDVFIGNNNFRDTGLPILINGTTYTNSGVVLRGSLNINGGIRVPYYFKKKETATLTGKVKLSGYLKVYLNLIEANADNPFFFKTISDQNATATITIRTRQGNPARFDVTSLHYDFVNQN